MNGKGKSRPASGSPKQPDGATIQAGLDAAAAPPRGGIPRIEIVIPVEGRPRVRLVCDTLEEELRLRVELERWRAAA
jgi:hypothetical protein